VGSRRQGLARNAQDHRMETAQVARAATAVEEWSRKHPVQALALRTGLKKPPADLQRLEQTHAETVRFLEGSRHRLADLEQAWPKKRLAYQQQLEREGEEIRKAKRYLGVIDGNKEHFQKFWLNEDQARRNAFKRKDLYRQGRDTGRGWNRKKNSFWPKPQNVPCERPGTLPSNSGFSAP
jgi:hypothetical protein